MNDVQNGTAESPLLLAVPAEVVARTLANADGYRVLRRLSDFSDEELGQRVPHGETTIGCAIDVETTGLDHRTDKIIELALQRFRFDENGRIIEVGEARTWREDPGNAISPEITRITGLTAADLKGHSIDDASAVRVLGSASVLVAHNASFDRPFVEARLPSIAGLPWACSCRDVKWKDFGFEGASLSQLLMQCGWFYDAHRAETDVLALLRLLDHPIGAEDRVLGRLLRHARQPTFEISALAAPFSCKDQLKGRGYRWDAAARSWTIAVAEADLETETDWLSMNVYRGVGEAAARRVDWTKRYAAIS